jgi:CubicO group peptidase (beta-lactamase class C family)
LRGDTVLLEKGYGQANVEVGAPNTPQTVFGIGSVTEQLTAAAILLLQEPAALGRIRVTAGGAPT